MAEIKRLFIGGELSGTWKLVEENRMMVDNLSLDTGNFEYYHRTKLRGNGNETIVVYVESETDERHVTSIMRESIRS